MLRCASAHAQVHTMRTSSPVSCMLRSFAPFVVSSCNPASTQHTERFSLAFECAAAVRECGQTDPARSGLCRRTRKLCCQFRLDMLLGGSRS